MTTREQRLRELLEKWRHLRHQPFSEWDEYGYATYEVTETCADELAAILAEPVEVSDEMVERARDAYAARLGYERNPKAHGMYADAMNAAITAALKEPGQ